MASTANGNIGNFTTVDGAPDARWFIEFMDLANSLPEYRDIKDGLITALGDLSGRTLLEVGCGTGDDARELGELVGAGQVVAIDLSQAMIDEARRRSQSFGLPVGFEVGDLRGLRFPDNSFDAARAKLVLMHCADIDAAIDEIVRVLRPGGRIAVFDYDFDTTIVDHPDITATREVMRCFSDGHHNNWSGRQLARRFRGRRLTEISVVPRTVLMPFHFFSTLTMGRLANAQEAGQLALTAGELEAWWKPVLLAEERGDFFASFTGFVVGATKP
jgi:ubiquinone/menaquinone biosynthesis C-methylase UbiE